MEKGSKFTLKLYEIDYLYPSLYFGIKSSPAVILEDHKYPQLSTPNFLVM